MGRVKVITYTLPGFLAALAGFLLASWQGAITSNQGSSYLLYAIAAPTIGGVSVFGGRGNTRGVLGSVLLLTVIQVGLAIYICPLPPDRADPKPCFRSSGGINAYSPTANSRFKYSIHTRTFAD